MVERVDAILAAVPIEERSRMGWRSGARCVDVVRRMSYLNEYGYYVEIVLSECGPDAEDLFSYVKGKLEEMGYSKIYVRGEW
jgi:hypothetical protein